MGVESVCAQNVHGYRLKTSAADPGCLSRIPDPDFYPSRIPDPKQQQKRGVNKNLLSYLFLYFEIMKKKI
jgi:hypothetical protein